MSFVTSQVYKTATATEQLSSIALVTGAKTGIGLAVARKIASFPFIEHVVAVSRSITQADTTAVDPKLVPLAADVATESGRQTIIDKVEELCGGRTKQLRFLIHAAGTINPITSVLKLKPAELRQAMLVNCEGPFFLTTALHSYMQPIGGSNGGSGLSGRVLHVSSGAAHGAPPVGWGAYGITKAAFFQTFRVLEHEFRDTGVVVGSFKPGVVDTDMQGVIRTAPDSDMPLVQKFIGLKEKAVGSTTTTASSVPRPPPAGALDTPDNVACFAEFLLLGTTDEEFANAQDASEWDIRHAKNFSKWIPAANLPQDE